MYRSASSCHFAFCVASVVICHHLIVTGAAAGAVVGWGAAVGWAAGAWVGGAVVGAAVGVAQATTRTAISAAIANNVAWTLLMRIASSFSSVKMVERTREPEHQAACAVLAFPRGRGNG